MNRYQRRIIMASIGLHILGLGALFFYWLFTDPFKEEKIPETYTQSAQSTGGGGNDNQPSDSEKITKNPNATYEEGDLSNQQLSEIINNSMRENESLTAAQKIDKLNDKLEGISRTPVKEIEKMSDIVKDALNIDKADASKKPIREMTAADVFDFNSSIVHDFIKDGDMISLIFKDKNNLTFKGEPEKYSELDPDIKMRVNMLQKAKENKKFQILLNTADAILENMQSKSENETSEKP